MSEPSVLAEATALIRGGQHEQAVTLLQAAVPSLPLEYHRKAHSYTGLAFYFAGEWAEAHNYFLLAADQSEVPEDHFNVAMARVKLGDIEGAHTAWQLVFDLSYKHKDAPETMTFFQKKLLFAWALRDAGAFSATGLDLLERQLMGFYTNYHNTDPHFWGVRGVPAFEEVMETTRDYYRGMGRPRADWEALCDRVAAEVDAEGKQICAQLKADYTA